MRHLSVVPTGDLPDLPDPLHDVIDLVARRYYRRAFAKPGAPEFDQLDPESQAEMRNHVEPIVRDALDGALDRGLHTPGGAW